MTRINFNLNGRAVIWQGAGSARLLDVLRDDFGQVDVKCGCREGECGACSILLDGLLVNSCLVAMGAVEGAEVTTIAGYKETQRFKILDAAFAAQSAVQCGYCIPGMVLAAEALLAKNPQPSEAEIRTGIAGNLCRCTGYNAIVNAISDGAKAGAGLW